MLLIKKKNLEPILLFFILIFSAVLRLPNVSNGLPYFVQVEEGLINHTVLNLTAQGLNPHDFVYPGFIYYFMLPIFSFFRIFLPQVLGALNFGDFFSYILLGRIVVVFFGLTSVFLIYQIGKKLYDSRTGLIAALFLAVDPMHVAWSFIFKPDMLMSTLTLVSFLCICKISDDGNDDKSAYLLTGLFIGLAIAAKYNAFLILIPFILAHLFKSQNKVYLLNKNLFLAFCFICLGFFIFNPFIILDFSGFLRDIRIELDRAVLGFPVSILSGYRGWISYPLIITSVLGPVMTILAACGLILGMRRQNMKDILVLSFPLAYYFIMGKFTNSAAHYALPCIPFLLLLAARFLKESLFAVGKVKKIKPWFYFLVVLVIITPSIWSSVYYIKWINQKETKLMAKEWIQANLPRGSKLFADIFSPYNPAGIPEIGSDYEIRSIKWRKKINYEDFFNKNNFDYIIVVCIEDRPLNEQRQLDYINQRFPLIKEFRPGIKRPVSHFMYSPLYHSTIKIYDGRKQKEGIPFPLLKSEKLP